jgi:iron complex outermembrane receptor protein
MRNRGRSTGFALAALLAVSAAGASRQTVAQDAEAGSEAEGAVLEEVVVTGQKRVESLQKTSAAITALGTEALVSAGVVDITAAQNLMPSVRFQSEGASTEIYIRGVGSTVDLPNVEPPTAFNFAGIYVPREGTSVGFYDIERIELLPGPQGTLYGRSALGGAVNVSFNRPTRELATNVLVEAGNYSLFHATLVQNVPLTDKVAVRGAFDYIKNDGYLTSGAYSRDDYAGRLSGLFEPTDDVSIYLWGHVARKHGKPNNLVRKGANGGTGDGDPHAFETNDPWNDILAPGVPGPSDQHYENAMLGGELTARLGGATLTYIPSYYFLDWASDYWIENVPAFLSAHYNQITNELRLAGAWNGWDWLAGLYQYSVRNSGFFTIGGFPISDVRENRLEGVAGFGQATYRWTDKLRLTFGGRVSKDKRSGAGFTSFGEPFDASKHFDNVDWKIGVEYDVADRSMLYGVVQTGYQPGTYNTFPSTPSQSNIVKAADLTAYTLGIKNRFLGDRLQVNSEAFYYDYRNLFAQSTNLGTGLLTTFNAKKVEVYGNQLDLLLQATPDDRVNLSVGYLHARNLDFVIPAELDVGTSVRDFAGYQLQNAPDWTVSLGYQHDFRFAGGYLRARADSRYESSYWAGYAHTRGTQQEPYIKTDASLTYYGSKGWSAGLWIKNIENEPVQAATAGGLGNWGAAFLEAPRTYGARVNVSF